MEVCKVRWPQCGLEKEETGWKYKGREVHWGEVQIRHVHSWQKVGSNSKSIEKKTKGKTPKDLRPKNSTFHTRGNGLTAQVTVMRRANGSMPNFRWRPKYREKIGKVQRTLHSR